MRVLFFGTHPKQFNGYSKVVYEMCKEVAKLDDVSLVIHGFQNFHDSPGHRSDLPPNVQIYDAFANENPKQAGFGVQQARQHVALAKPDVVVLYNDMVVICSLLEELRHVPNRKFKIIAYIDQVYLNQKKEHVEFVNTHADRAILFTEPWRDCIVKQGLRLHASVLPHAFNSRAYFPVPKHLARRYFGLPEKDFIVLNLNRNQPRKRWDTCLKAFAEMLLRTKDAAPEKRKPRLVIATEMTGGWNLVDILERELSRRGLDVQAGMAQVSRVDAPQRMTDEDTNFLYNVADVGINTCDGEGFGLCNFEQAAIGVPQIVPKLGGFVTFFDDECAYMVEPRLSYYVDASRDAIGGEAQMCDHRDFADGLVAYYDDDKLLARHGRNARRKLLREYKWDQVARDFVAICRDAIKPTESPSVGTAANAGTAASVGTPSPNVEDAIKKGGDNTTKDNTTNDNTTKDNTTNDNTTKEDEIKKLKQRLQELMAASE